MPDSAALLCRVFLASDVQVVHISRSSRLSVRPAVEFFYIGVSNTVNARADLSMNVTLRAYTEFQVCRCGGTTTTLTYITHSALLPLRPEDFRLVGPRRRSTVSVTRCVCVSCFDVLCVGQATCGDQTPGSACLNQSSLSLCNGNGVAVSSTESSNAVLCEVCCQCCRSPVAEFVPLCCVLVSAVQCVFAHVHVLSPRFACMLVALVATAHCFIHCRVCVKLWMLMALVASAN